MRIGPVAVVLLVLVAAGVGWWVWTQSPTESGSRAPASTQASAQVAQPAAFDAGAPLPQTLTATADSINNARFAAAAPPPASDAAAATTDPASTTPASARTGSGQTAAAASAVSGTEGRGPQDAAVAERTAGTRVDPAVIRAQVLLDRAHFSPGVIDGRDGENYQNALKAFERDRGFNPDGRLDEQTFAALTQGDERPAVRGYRITDEDVRGPFNPQVPTETREMRGLDRVPYRDAAEALAEKFHMDEDLLRQLNPGANFGQAGQVILVAAVGDQQRLAAEVDRIEVDADRVQVRAYAGDRLVGLFPATVGSSSFPSPSGTMTVTAVAPNPTYTYDPARLSFGDGGEAFTVAAGPNNPVGSTWIDLSEPTYGIHGAPEPSQIGKTASHGCVRLTNWDAALLGRSVRRGATVTFMGTRTGGAPASATQSGSRSGSVAGASGSGGRSASSGGR